MEHNGIKQHKNGTVGLALMFFLFFCLSAGPAVGDPLDATFNCWYVGGDSPKIWYSVTGGQSGSVYRVDGFGYQTIGVQGPCPNLQGINDTKSVSIRCNDTSPGPGKAKIIITIAPGRTNTWEFCFSCTGENDTPQLIECKTVPTLSEWVLILLALSVGAFFVWQLKRRRKATVSVQ